MRDKWDSYVPIKNIWICSEKNVIAISVVLGIPAELDQTAVNGRTIQATPKIKPGAVQMPPRHDPFVGRIESENRIIKQNIKRI